MTSNFSVATDETRDTPVSQGILESRLDLFKLQMCGEVRDMLTADFGRHVIQIEVYKILTGFTAVLGVVAIFLILLFSLERPADRNKGQAPPEEAAPLTRPFAEEP